MRSLGKQIARADGARQRGRARGSRAVGSRARGRTRQYSSQHALPIWTPHWPRWMEMTSRMIEESFGIATAARNVTFGISRQKPTASPPISPKRNLHKTPRIVLDQASKLASKQASRNWSNRLRLFRYLSVSTEELAGPPSAVVVVCRKRNVQNAWLGRYAFVCRFN